MSRKVVSVLLLPTKDSTTLLKTSLEGFKVQISNSSAMGLDGNGTTQTTTILHTLNKSLITGTGLKCTFDRTCYRRRISKISATLITAIPGLTSSASTPCTLVVPPYLALTQLTFRTGLQLMLVLIMRLIPNTKATNFKAKAELSTQLRFDLSSYSGRKISSLKFISFIVKILLSLR